MAKVAVEHIFTGQTNSISSYDYTKTNIGSLIKQLSGVSSVDNFIGPMPIGLARPMEASTAIPGIFPHVVSYNNNLDWVFLADNSTAAATRRIIFYEFNKINSSFNWKGFITLTYPTATAHTIRGFRVFRELYTGGTVSVNNTIVTGSGTTWFSDNMTIGSRIGFGSTNPNEITTWYEISNASADTTITLTTSAGISGSTSYVIEDLKIGTTTTNATTTNGGLFLTKGLRIENFTPGGTTIPAATTVDNIRAVYWLADAATVTNIGSAGLAMEEKTSWSNQNAYVLDSSNRIFKYNLRIPLTGITAGKSTNAFLFNTGVQTPTGTMSLNNNGRVATMQHGPGNGVLSLYWVTTSRVYRSALSAITSGSITWQSDTMVEVPPGGTTTFAATSTLSSVEIASSLDSLIVMNTGAAGARSYVTKYNTISSPFDKIFLIDSKELDQSTADSGTVPHPGIQASTFSVWSENGICYLARHGTTAAVNQVYSLPLGADWSYTNTTNERIITPELQTPNASKYYRLYISDNKNLTSSSLSLNVEPYRVYYRTSGINDNSGSWTLVPNDGLLTSIYPSNSIQFMFEFKTIGTFCIPARIFSVSLVYEDSTTDSRFQPSIGLSDITNKRFAWRLSSSFGGPIPNLRVRLYDAISNSLLLDDNTASPTGTFEKTTDGGLNWAAWDNSDKTNEITYLRYTPLSLGDNIRVRALLTLN
jgi:hypothetical protein